MRCEGNIKEEDERAEITNMTEDEESWGGRVGQRGRDGQERITRTDWRIWIEEDVEDGRKTRG